MLYFVVVVLVEDGWFFDTHIWHALGRCKSVNFFKNINYWSHCCTPHFFNIWKSVGYKKCTPHFWNGCAAPGWVVYIYSAICAQLEHVTSGRNADIQVRQGHAWSQRQQLTLLFNCHIQSSLTLKLKFFTLVILAEIDVVTYPLSAVAGAAQSAYLMKSEHGVLCCARSASVGLLQAC